MKMLFKGSGGLEGVFITLTINLMYDYGTIIFFKENIASCVKPALSLTLSQC